MSDKIRVGWIGTGVMGLHMAGHLQKSGYPLTVFNRTAAKARPLIDNGAVLAKSPREVGENSDIVFSIVGYPSDVESVTIGPEGALWGLNGKGILVDMTTSSPELAAKIAATAAEQGVASLDAPVTGSDVGARTATLSIFVGGEKNAFEKVLPLFQVMGKRIAHCGGPGMGQQAKLANQVAIAGVMFSVCESLLYAREAGLDVRTWMELASAGAGGSVAMQNLGPRMLDGNYDPGFFIEHYIKDLKMVVDECERMGLTLSAVLRILGYYQEMQADGRGRLGTQAIITRLAEQAGREWKPIPKK